MRTLPAIAALLLCCAISGCGGCSKENAPGPDRAGAGQAPSRADDAAYVESLKEMGSSGRKLASEVAKAEAALEKAKADSATAPEELKRLEDELEAARAARKEDLKASRAKILARIKADAKNANDLKEQKK